MSEQKRTFNTHPFTEDGVVARLTETGKRYLRRKLADQFNVTTPEMRAMLDGLVAKGLIEIAEQGVRTALRGADTVYFVPQEPEPTYLPDGFAAYRSPLEFRPLVGYEARMREFADRRAA